jgi:ATPase subunit of ABC transporter with duplicated ATPase domains
MDDTPLTRTCVVQVCNKIIETEFGNATTYRGNYTQAMRAKAEKIAAQWSAYDKWSKEVQKQKDIIRRYAAAHSSTPACCDVCLLP